MVPFIGEIRTFPFNFAPSGWAACDGSLLPINQYQPLFSLIGTTYGGDGQQTFGLPDLRGRVAVHQGQGIGLSAYLVGQTGGAETVTLTTPQFPAHTHSLNAQSGAGNSTLPINNTPAASTTNDNVYSSTATNATMNANAIGQTGGGQPHENMPPFLVIGYFIATDGIYPVPD